MFDDPRHAQRIALHFVLGLLAGSATAGVVLALSGGIILMTAYLSVCATIVYWLLAYIAWGSANMDE